MSQPPIVPTSITDSVRVALSYLRGVHAVVSRIGPLHDSAADLLIAITTLEKALRAEEDTKETTIP